MAKLTKVEVRSPKYRRITEGRRGDWRTLTNAQYVELRGVLFQRRSAARREGC